MTDISDHHPRQTAWSEDLSDSRADEGNRTSVFSLGSWQVASAVVLVRPCLACTGAVSSSPSDPVVPLCCPLF